MFNELPKGFLKILRFNGIGIAISPINVWNYRLENSMFHESTFDAGSVFGSGLFVEDFLPVLSVIAFGYIMSCLAFAFLN